MMFPPEQPKEKYGAQQRKHQPRRQLGRRTEDTSCGITKDNKRTARQRGAGQEIAVIRTDDEPDNMRCDQPDEPEESGGTHPGPGEQRRQRKENDAVPFKGKSQIGCGFIAQFQNIEFSTE